MAKSNEVQTKTIVNEEPSALATLMSKGQELTQRQDVKDMAKGAAVTVGAFFLIKGIIATAVA